jgi:hypothetical protein
MITESAVTDAPAGSTGKARFATWSNVKTHMRIARRAGVTISRHGGNVIAKGAGNILFHVRAKGASLGPSSTAEPAKAMKATNTQHDGRAQASAARSTLIDVIYRRGGRLSLPSGRNTTQCFLKLNREQVATIGFLGEF